MPESGQINRDKFRFVIYHGHIHILPICEKIEDKDDIKDIKERIKEMLDIINSKEKPKINIGKHCKDPYECPLSECWEHLPENHVFCLYRGGKLSYELYDNGINSIKDIPDDIKLDDKQGIQKKGKIHIHKERIRHFLKNLNYPLYFLDFETFSWFFLFR